MNTVRQFRFPPYHALALFLATLLCELPVAVLRYLLAIAALAILAVAGVISFAHAGDLAQLAFVPTGWALFALITPWGGGWWWRQNMGGRPPSERERLAVADALQLLGDHAVLPLREPSGWFVLDTPELDACVCGDTLMLSRGLIDSSHLAAVLAHELAHLDSSDGRLTAALNRLVLRAPRPVEERPRRESSVTVAAGDSVMTTITVIGLFYWLGKKVTAYARGGTALRLLGPFWGSYWREREYRADAYAASLGQGEELATFLETHALFNDGPVPFLWLTEYAHPPSELRIDRLRKQVVAAPPQLAPGPEPLKPAPPGPPAAGPDGPGLTEPAPSAFRSLTSAGRALPSPTTREPETHQPL